MRQRLAERKGEATGAPYRVGGWKGEGYKTLSLDKKFEKFHANFSEGIKGNLC